MITKIKDSKKDLLSKLWSIRSHLKLEFISIFFLCPMYFSMIGLSSFELQKACHVNLNIDAETCDQLNNVRYKEICTLIQNNVHESEESPIATMGKNETLLLRNDEVFQVIKQSGRDDVEVDELMKILKVCDAERDSQKFISKTYSIRAPIATSIQLLIVIFAGAWSDKHDIRKIFILFSFVSEILGTSIYITSSIFFNEIPIDVTIYLASISMALLGGKCLYTIGIDSYLAITTTESYRTFRIGFYSMFRTSLGIFASPLGGVFFEIMSYKQIFVVNFITQLIGFLFVIFWLPDVKAQPSIKENGNIKEEKPPTEKSLDNSDSKPQKSPNDTPSPKIEEKKSKPSNFCTDFFDPSHIKDAIKVLSVVRPDNKRKILLFVVILNIVMCATYGEDDLYILYGRKALSWTTEFSIFVSYYTVIGIIGTGIAILVFSKWLKMSDPTMAMISIAGSLAANPILAFAHSTLMAYIGVTVDFFYYVRYFIIKSMISKLVDTNEMGRVYSLLGITENVDMIIFVPMYALIYYHTLEILPGAFFLFSNIFLLTAFIILIYIRCLFWRVTKSGENPSSDI